MYQKCPISFLFKFFFLFPKNQFKQKSFQIRPIKSASNQHKSTQKNFKNQPTNQQPHPLQATNTQINPNPQKLIAQINVKIHHQALPMFLIWRERERAESQHNQTHFVTHTKCI